MMTKLRVAVFFGGRSTEHEVSVVSAIQACEHLDTQKYEIIPIYISKTGDFYTNEKFLDIKNFKDVRALLLASTKITLSRKDGAAGFHSFGGLRPRFTPFDIAFPIFHGSFGEDGAIQGLFEMVQTPYVGFNVTGSAIGMDKIASKAIFVQLGLPIGKFATINRRDWIADQETCLHAVTQTLQFPMFVKPATIGSSIGVNKANDRDKLSFNIEVAATYAEKILIEEAFENCLEVNCSALGYREVEASVCEMPIASAEVLSFQDKYQRGGKGSKGAGMASLSRQIPAPISNELTKKIQDATIKIFKAMDGCGVARIDYFVDKEKEQFWVNEINTPPGSLAYYLWEKNGVSFAQLLDRLIQCGLDRVEDQKKTQYTFESGLLEQMAKTGLGSGQKR